MHAYLSTSPVWSTGGRGDGMGGGGGGESADGRSQAAHMYVYGSTDIHCIQPQDIMTPLSNKQIQNLKKCEECDDEFRHVRRLTAF